MQDQPVLIALLAIAAGIFSLLDGINNWDWLVTRNSKQV